MLYNFRTTVANSDNKMERIMRIKNGFTLSEVLITLGVIGVISAITLPTVVKNYQKHVIENRLKKSYSIINQALNMSIAENGDIKNWTFPQSNTADENYKFAQTYLLPYLKVIKDCNVGKGCWADKEYNMNGSNSLQINDINYIIKFILSDGSAVALYFSETGGHLYLDVNGISKPNTRGKDIFEFAITNDFVNGSYIKPNGYQYSSNDVTSKCKGGGTTCAKILMDNGWKFPKDYPW